MKRFVALLLALCLFVPFATRPARAVDGALDAVGVVQTLGIITGDGSGSLALDRNVTRAEFAKMLVAASPYKDATGTGTGYSLFKDLKSNHWAAGYVKVCVENGWFQGYMDGTFRPNNPITLEEAATVALRLLGYTASDLPGAYPDAQLAKFEALNLHSGFSTARGQAMSRRDCAHLFTNLISTKTKEGQFYGASLGYTLDQDGKLDYAALVNQDTEGPFTLTGTLDALLPFPAASATVYRNGAASSPDSASPYDICYYNEPLRTVWLYSNRVTGLFTAASPSKAAPTAVTVAGVEYQIESSTASYKLSTQGPYSLGQTVTLLLGMNGGVADVCEPTGVASVFYGVVKSTSVQPVTDANGSVSANRTVRVACTDGVERSFTTSDLSLATGAPVRVDYNAAQPVFRLNENPLSGSVDANGSSFAGRLFASDVEILDTDKYGAAKRVYPSRLAGCKLSKENVLYCQTNTRGEITHLLLRDATGDCASFGLVLDASQSVALSVSSSSFRCLIDGKETAYNFSSTVFPVSRGAARLVYNADGQVVEMRNLAQLSLSSLDGLNATAAGASYPVAEDAQVYIARGGSYVAATIDSVRDTVAYSLTAYLDNLGNPAGGRIRILVATPK